MSEKWFRARVAAAEAKRKIYQAEDHRLNKVSARQRQRLGGHGAEHADDLPRSSEHDAEEGW